MTDQEKSILEKCIGSLNDIDQMLEEWEPELQQAASHCVRTNLFIRYMLNTHIKELEDMIM